LVDAAVACGSCIQYVRAAIVLLKSENASLLERVLRGNAPLLQTAAEAQRLADLVAAYRKARPEDLQALGRAVGAENLFTAVIEPVIG
jgi:hypothetical protein